MGEDWIELNNAAPITLQNLTVVLKDTQNRLEDYLIGLKKFHELADYITINISSPNTENLRNLHNQSRLDELLNEIKKEK